MKIFEFAVILHPTDEERKAGKSSLLVVPITPVLAVDEKQAGMLAGRAIPTEHLDKLNRMEVAVRPF